MKTAWKWNCSWLAAALLVTGCAKFDLRKNIPWGEGKDGRIEQPMRVETAWVDTVLTKPGEKPVRGFGGRLYFFGPNNNQESCKVEGTLVVYAFDETNRDPTNVVPDRKVVYPAKDFATLYSKSKLGHSYSVWVPWGDVDGPTKNISLIARFIPAKGGPVASEQMKVLLPGTTPLIDVRSVDTQVAPHPLERQTAGQGGTFNESGVQQASFQQPTGDNATPIVAATDPRDQKLSSYTIPLRSNQTRYFTQQNFTQQSGMSGGAQVSYVDASQAAGWAANRGAFSTAGQASSMVQPLPSLPAQRSTTLAPMPQGPNQPPGHSSFSGGQPSQIPRSSAMTTAAQPSARFAPWRPPARATLAAQPQFGHDRWEPRPAVQQFDRSWSRSQATLPQHPGSGQVAGQPLTQAPPDRAGAY